MYDVHQCVSYYDISLPSQFTLGETETVMRERLECFHLLMVMGIRSGRWTWYDSDMIAISM